MGELGFSIKFWKLESTPQEFKARDTVTFVFQDRPPEEWSRLGSLIEELSGTALQGKVADILAVKQEESEEGSDSKVAVKVERKEDANNDDEDFDPSQYYSQNGKRELDSDSDMKDEINYDVGCENCGVSFSNRRKMVAHLIDCNPEQIEELSEEEEDSEDDYSDSDSDDEPRRKRKMNMESCDNCLREFKQRSNLIRHLEECNPDQLMELPKLKKRKVSSTGGAGPYTCRVCHRQFIFKKSLHKHEELHSDDPEHASLLKSKSSKRKKSASKNAHGQYQCDRCECDFKVFSALDRHMEAHDLAAKSTPNQADIEEGSGFKMIDIRDGKIMRCKRCDLAFKSHGVYRMHMQKFHKKMFHCEECSKKFTLPNTLIKHRLNYHTNFPKSCADCGIVLPTKHQFVRHVNTQHGTAFQESNVPCEICGKLVKNKYTLKQHVKLVHEKKKGEFACDQCGKVLKSKGSLDYHKRTHTGEFAYRCDECGRGHMRYDKMMECLAEHQGIHKYQCPHCEYKSNQLGYYKNHLTTHSDVKPFSCPICGHLSSTSSNLNSHTTKVHKITLCQAEGMMKRNRHGREMNEEELEQNKITLQRNQKVPGEPTRVVAEARKRGKPNRAPAPQQQPPVVHHDAAVAQHSWESNMARIEAGIRQDMMNRHEMARHENALGRLDPHALNRIENLSREDTIPKQERHLPEEAANLVMPRHMLFPVHKYF